MKPSEALRRGMELTGEGTGRVFSVSENEADVSGAMLIGLRGTTVDYYRDYPSLSTTKALLQAFPSLGKTVEFDGRHIPILTALRAMNGRSYFDPPERIPASREDCALYLERMGL